MLFRSRRREVGRAKDLSGPPRMLGNMKERDRFENQGLYWRIILKYILKELNRGRRLDSCGL